MSGRELRNQPREKVHFCEKKSIKKDLTTEVRLIVLSAWLTTTSNPTVTGGDQDVQDELISLQNKGVALKADRIDDRSFVFKCSKARLEKAFVRQWICKRWLDDGWCELYKGEKGGFYPEAKDFARQKIGQMRRANWLYKQASVPHAYTQGKVSAEKDSGNWSDVLTSVLKSV